MEVLIKTRLKPVFSRKNSAKVIATLFRKRQIADYEFNITINKDETKEIVKKAKHLIESLIEYLVKKNFINSVPFNNKI